MEIILLLENNLGENCVIVFIAFIYSFYSNGGKDDIFQLLAMHILYCMTHRILYFINININSILYLYII